MATLGDLNVDALAALGDNPQGDIDTMFILLSGFMVRPHIPQALLDGTLWRHVPTFRSASAS